MGIQLASAADIAQGLERLTVAEEGVGSRLIIRPKFPLFFKLFDELAEFVVGSCEFFFG